MRGIKRVFKGWLQGDRPSVGGRSCKRILTMARLTCLALAIGCVGMAYADAISFQLQSSDLIAASGGEAIFQGTVTNQSGTDLNASDFFFNFSGFDFTSVNPIQDLGVVDFPIPNGTTSGPVDLFEVLVGVVPSGSKFTVDVQLEDALSDLSSLQTVTVSIPSTTAVPEPATLSMMMVLLALLLVARRGRWFRARRQLSSFLLFAFVAGVTSQAFAQAPVFSTKTPVSGLVNQTFEVLLPVVNSGAAAATNVTVTSISLGTLKPQFPALPFSKDALNPNDHFVIDLQFDGTKLTVGSNYLLTVRGTYQSGTKVLGFSVNRFVQVTNPSTDVMAVLQKWIVLDAISVFCNSLPGIDPLSDSQATLTFLQGRPEFVASGMEPDGSSVWARFANGESIIICNDRPITDNSTSTAAEPELQAAARPPSRRPRLGAPALSANTATPTDVPQSSKARMLNAFTASGWIDPQVVLDLDTWLVQQSYSLAGGSASVDDLKGVGGEGVFYFSTHGGFVGKGTPDDPRLYALWTTTEADIANDDELAPDFLLHRVVYMHAVDSFDPKTNKPVRDWHEGITAEFVTRYWQNFSAGSLVYIDACKSDTDTAFKQAILAKSASVYVGWTFSVDDTFAGNTARLVFDRLLGANAFALEQGFPQRPFEYGSVQVDLPLHNLGVKSPVKFLDFTANSTGPLQFGLLAPSIMDMQVQEGNHELFILGSFGQDPGADGHITVGDTRVALVQLWGPGQLVVDISDPNLAGDVTVEVRGHKSNVARLTKWVGDFVYDVKAPETLAQNLTMHAAFRADMRQYRPLIHQPAVEPTAPVTETDAASSATFSCSGTHTFSAAADTVTTETWFGNGTVTSGVARNRNGFIVSGGFQGSHTQLQLGFSLDQQNSLCTLHDHSVITDPDGTQTYIDTDPDPPLDFCFGSTDVTFDLNDSAVISSGFLPSTGVCGIFSSTQRLHWETVAPVSGTEPDPLSAR